MTAGEEKDRRQRLEQARMVALFRYSLIQEVISPGLTAAQRGRRVRELAAARHYGPSGQDIGVSYQSINRWKRAYLEGGFEALMPSPRQATPRTPAEVLDLAAALKRENPERTAAQVQRILRATSGWAPSDRTLQRLFGRLELNRPAADDDGQQRVFGRFQASRPNELWTGDALHGPVVAGRKTYLFCFIDDHSRAVMGARWAFHEDVVRLAAALRPALAARGVPESVYVVVLAIPGPLAICPAACGNDTPRRSLTLQAHTGIVRCHLDIYGVAEVCGGWWGSSSDRVSRAGTTGRAA